MIIYLSREYYRKWQEAEKTNKELQAHIAELEGEIDIRKDQLREAENVRFLDGKADSEPAGLDVPF